MDGTHTMSKSVQGLVLRCIGGFYYVEAADTVYTCRARGAFRKQGVTPVAGDRVTITVQDNGEGTLQEVLQRRNVMVRPPVANVDVLVLVASICEPVTNTLVLDKMIAVAEHKGITPLVVVNKSDLQDPTPLLDIYERAGLECYAVCAHTPTTLDALRRRLSGCVSVFTGNSGVGKSSIINGLYPSLLLETAAISQKLGRGRHTTRTAALYPMGDGYLVDTPGFSSLDMEMVESIDKDDLPDCFREFAPYLGGCRFTGCAHYREPDCAVRNAVQKGVISPSRYDSYVSMYEAVKDKKEWEKP